jgi:histidinol-phosphate aminotransferase
MTTSLSRRAWLQRSAMAAAILPVSRWYRPNLEEYLAPRNEEMAFLRLNSNENAYGPGDASRQAIINSLHEANRYPRAYIQQLYKAIAANEGTDENHILITAGSTEILGLAGLVYGLHRGELLACHPTFDFLLLYAEKMGCKWARTPLDENYQYDLNALSKLTGKKTRLIFICNPNNPTGVEIPTDSLRFFIESHAPKHPVYIDEAYIELSPNGLKSSMASLVDQYPNLIIGRTFSKIYGLAGMRIGYALGHPDTIKKLSAYHTGRGITLSVAGAAAALAALEDTGFASMSRQKITEGRNLVCSAFDQWGVNYLPSATNFVFFKNEKFSMAPRAAMEQENILIRDYKDVPGWTRVSIGKVEEMEAFVQAAGKYILT